MPALLPAPFASYLASWRNLDVNLNGVFLCTRAVIDEMRASQRGRIINIASTASLKGYAYVSAYTAAKHGVLGLTRALALEVATTGITVNAVCPGYTDTDIIGNAVDTIVSKTGKNKADTLTVATNPQKRLITRGGCSNRVWLLAGVQGINGESISIGGKSKENKNGRCTVRRLRGSTTFGKQKKALAPSPSIGPSVKIL